MGVDKRNEKTIETVEEWRKSGQKEDEVVRKEVGNHGRREGKIGTGGT